jgi:hypothetical protein
MELTQMGEQGDKRVECRWSRQGTRRRTGCFFCFRICVPCCAASCSRRLGNAKGVVLGALLRCPSPTGGKHEAPLNRCR